MSGVAPWMDLFVFSSLYLGTLILILVISSLIILKGNRSVTVVVVAALIFFCGPVGINTILAMFVGPRIRGDFATAVVYSYAFFGGAISCLGIGLSVFRILGFELRHPANASTQ